MHKLSGALTRAYPEPQGGFHRVTLQVGDGDDPVFLTLLYGEVHAALAQLETSVDAWFLDGFSPEKNPEMWRPEVMAEVAHLSHGVRALDDGEALGFPGGPTRLATYAVAGNVRRALTDAGFEIARAPALPLNVRCSVVFMAVQIMPFGLRHRHRGLRGRQLWPARADKLRLSVQELQDAQWRQRSRAADGRQY